MHGRLKLLSASLPLAVAKIIAGSRASGNLNLGGRELQYVPSSVYDQEEQLPEGSSANTGGNWWEVAELTKLDLSRNSISSLPDQLARLSTLTSIDCSFNQLQQLFDTVGHLQQLRLLACSSNKLTYLPDAVASLPALASLSCSDNQIRLLPQWLGLHQGLLASIVVANNLIEILPPGLAGCSSLTMLDLQGNKMREIGQGSLPASLTELNLCRNRLEGVLCHEVGYLKKLRVLSLKENKLTGLPASLGGCAAMIECHVGFNSLSGVPAEFGACSSLRVLDLRNNRISELPDGICSLKLSLLDLTNNDLQKLPPRLGLMTSLRSLPLDGNPLRQIPRNVVAGPCPDAVHGCPDGRPTLPRRVTMFAAAGQELVLKGAGLRELPAEVWQAAAGLVRLDISNNQACCAEQATPSPSLQAVTAVSDVRFAARSLPPECLHPPTHRDALAGCSILQVLHMGSTGLHHWPLPPHPGCLPRLRQLVLRCNPSLRGLPQGAFDSCPSLRSLDLSGIPAASQLPRGCLANGCPSLEEIDLSTTGTSYFPMELLHLPCLRVINLTGNQLAEVPDGISTLTRQGLVLDALHLANNNLSSLPPSLGTLSLKTLTLEGNILKTIRRGVLERGTPAVLQYLKDKMPI
ncbi:MAG: hypothetical protein WDW38_004066 [Sanguina aurantia]